MEEEVQWRRFDGGGNGQGSMEVVRWRPPWAAELDVDSSHGQPFACNHCTTSRWPPRAAHVSGRDRSGTSVGGGVVLK